MTDTMFKGNLMPSGRHGHFHGKRHKHVAMAKLTKINFHVRCFLIAIFLLPIFSPTSQKISEARRL